MNRFIVSVGTTIGSLVLALIIYRGLTINSQGYDIFDLLAGRPFVASASSLGQSQPVLRGEPVMDINDFRVLSKVNTALADLSEAVVPSVVSIDTKTTVNVRRTYSSDPFGFFLYQRNQKLEKPGLGSGAIVSEDGFIVTNHHVVTGVDEIQVTTHDGGKFEAEWIGSDPNADIAVLKIVQPIKEGDPIKFKPLPFGDSDKVRVGEMVLAIGNPFGLSETVTRGIISAKQRQVSDSANEYFQVDAVINPGNSGGPLVNIRGEIIGVNVAIFTGQQNVKVWQGIGLAVPGNEAKEIYNAIAFNRELARGYIGVELDDIPQQYLRLMNIDDGKAALVASVVEDSPAERVGLQAGDVILEFDGKKIADAQDLLNRILRKKRGDRAEIKLLRRGTEMVMKPEFVSKSGKNTLELKRSISENGKAIADALGIKVSNLSPQQRQAMNLGNGDAAVVISNVKTGTQASSRFEVGDLVHIINRDYVDSVQRFYDLLGNLPQDRSSIVILSRNGRKYEAVLNP